MILKSIFLFVLSLSCFAPVFSQQGWDWVISDDNNTSSYALDIITDNENNTYTTGYFGDQSFNQSSFGDTLITATASTNTFVTKSDSSGNVLWTYMDGSVESSFARCITMDNSSNIYISGFSVATGRTFITKLDTSGQFLWRKEFGTGFNPLSYDPYFNGKNLASYNNKICFASSDSLFVINDQGSLISGKPAETGAITTLPGVGFLTNYETFISTYDSTLNLIDVDTIGTGAATIRAMICKNNSVYITGNFTGTFDCGGNSLTAQGIDIFVTKWSDDLETFNWSISEGDSQNEYSYDIDIDDLGNLYISGSYRNFTNFSGSTYGDWGDFEEIYVARFNEQTGGYYDMAIAGGPRENEHCYGIDISSDNALFACGTARYYWQPTYFGNIMNSGAGYFIAKLRPVDATVQFTGVVLEANVLTHATLDIYYELTPLNFIKVYDDYASNGYFVSPFFYDKGNYLIKAREFNLSNSSATYYGDEYMWYNSTIINIQSDSNWHDTINLIEVPSLVGTDTIAGNVTDSITGDPYGFIDVMLTSDTDELLSFTLTDSLGHYSFNNVPSGDYRVYIDISGYFMDSYHTVSLLKSQNSYDFLIGSNLIYADGQPNSILVDYQANINIYPNPNNGVLYINGLNNNSTIVELYELNGKLIFREELSCLASENHQIKTSNLTRGVYMLLLKTSDQIIKSEKIIIE